MKNLTARVQDLELLDLTHDIPSADAGPISLNYSTSYDTNFEDYGPFCSGFSRFLEEALSIKHINDIVREGMEVHTSLLYTWRSIMRPIISIEVKPEETQDLYQAQYTVLFEPIVSLTKLLVFVENAVNEFSKVIDKAVNQDMLTTAVSEGILIAIGRMINMFIILDDLKAAKTSVKNDLSYFKRLLLLLKKSYNDTGVFDKMDDLSKFIAEPTDIVRRMKDVLSSDPHRYKIMFKVLAVHADILENKQYYSPHRRFEIVRILMGCLSLLKDDNKAASKFEQNKISLNRLDKLFRETPLIPLVGDMSCYAGHLLKRAQISFDFALLDSGFMQKNAASFGIIDSMAEFQSQHMLIISELLILVYESTIAQTHKGLHDISYVDAARVYAYVDKTLRTVGRWSYALHQLFFYKMANPAKRPQQDGSEDIDSYSLATRYNYSNLEKSAISRLVFMIKSIFKILKKHENLISSAIEVHIYAVFQNFVQTTLSKMHRKSQKSKNNLYMTILDVLMKICSDAVDSPNTTKSKKSDSKYSLKQRCVSPLSTQIYMLKTMLETILAMKDSKKLINSELTQQIQTYLSECAMFQDLTEFSRTLDECTRLDTLWFKDFYIEISAGKHIQYPIGDSIPWIMIEHLLNINETNSAEFLLYLTCIYDDAAQCTLHRLKRRHLFDEIDSEAQLVFKQLCYHLGIRIYTTRRSESFNFYLNKTVKNHVYRRLVSIDRTYLGEGTIPYQVYQQLFNLCKQRSIQFLGRRIDLNSMLAQRLLINLKESIKTCISYYDSQSIHSVVLLSSLIDIYGDVHASLLQHFDLPPFQVIFDEVNGNMPGYYPHITMATLRFLIKDVAQDYSFCSLTERFVKSPQLFTRNSQSQTKGINQMIYPSKCMGYAFEDCHSLYTQFVGIEHFVEIFKLVGYSGILILVEEIKKCIAYLLATTIKEYIRVIRKAMPLKFILPRAAYGFSGVLESFDALFEAILQYEQMRSGVLHNFRILGNYVVIVYMLERAVYIHEARVLYLTAPFTGVFSSSIPVDDPSAAQKLDQAFEFMKCFTFEKFPAGVISDEFSTLLRKANALNQERLCCGLSLFASLIEFFSENMKDTFWSNTNPQDNIISDDCGELHRIISVLFYYMALSMKDPAQSAEYVFGDGVMFGGLMLIVSLGQEHLAEAHDICNHAISVSEIEAVAVVQIQFTTSTLRHTMRKSPRESGSSEISEAVYLNIIQAFENFKFYEASRSQTSKINENFDRYIIASHQNYNFNSQMLSSTIFYTA